MTTNTRVVPGDLAVLLVTDGGFTYDPAAGALVEVGDRDGWAIALNGTERLIVDPTDTREFDTAFTSAEQEARERDCLVGGWYSDQRHAYIVEVTSIADVDRQTALTLGAVEDQETIINMRTGEFVTVPWAEVDG